MDIILERDQLRRLAHDAGMTIPEWIEYSQKAQIYLNAGEVLRAKGRAA